MVNNGVTKLLALTLLALPFAAGQSLNVVKTESGSVSGAIGNQPAIRTYKGIPYAAPPVGDLRWKEPQPAAAWKGVRDATAFGPECMQTGYAESSPYYSPPQPSSEDCLTLNVWTAAKSPAEKRPVMVWIHGGAFTKGSGSTPTYDGEMLASKGVVVVTINYRLGAFGFLAHPELSQESPNHVSGNYALLDQIAALKWVQRNIAAFGGDPKCVTIFGESAGSWAVNFLTASPLAHGLFHRAIGESGANFARDLTLAAAEKQGSAWAAQRLNATTLAEMRAKSADEVLKAGGPAAANIDGWFLPESVAQIFAHGKQNDTPILVGYNHDESTTLAPWPASGTAKSFVSQLSMRYGKVMDEFLKAYPAESDAQAKESYNAIWRDQTFGWEMRTWARQQSKTGKSRAYMYFFTHAPMGPMAAKYGAFHAAEIAYAFDNLTPARRQDATERALADAMSSYWANFAATGDPNLGPSHAGPNKVPVKWPVYTASEDASMVFGDVIEVKRDVNKAGLDFLDHFMALQSAPAQSAGGGRQ